MTFASPSAVIELEQALGKTHFDRLLTSAAAVAIGPTTARALTERGYPPVMAEVRHPARARSQHAARTSTQTLIQRL